MNVLDRYLARAVLSGTLLVLLVLLALTSFIAFIGQVDNVGTGSYTIADVIIYVLLTLPAAAYEMFPIAVLIGSLIGLGALASHSELIVMRAAGISIWRLALAVSFAGLILASLAAAIGELVAPAASQFAVQHRTMRMHDQLSIEDPSSVWVRDSDLIVNIESRLGRTRVGGVYVFSLAAENRIESISRASSAGFGSGGDWYLYDLHVSKFSPTGVVSEFEPRSQQRTALSPELLDLAVVDPDTLESSALFEYARYLEENGLDAYQYLVAFWARVANVIAVIVMAWLALPFVFGPLRSTGAGQRLLIGVLIGVAYFIGARTLANTGAVYGLEPALVTFAPVLLLAAVSFAGLVRER